MPVPTDVRHWFASPRSGVGFLVHAAALDTARPRPAPLSDNAGRVGHGRDGDPTHSGARQATRLVALIRHEPDVTITRIVATWPRAFDARRAGALGFRAETNFDDIVHAHIEDELGGRIGATQ